MNRVNEVLKGVLLVAGVFALSGIGYKAWKIPDLAATVTKLNLELDEAHRVTLEAGLTAMEARKASALELQVLPQINAKVQTTLDTTNKTIANLQDIPKTLDKNLSAMTMHVNGLLDTANTGITDAKPILKTTVDKLDLELDDLHTATFNVGAFFNSSDLTGIIHNGNTISYNFAATTTDFQTKFHAFLYPIPCHGFKCQVAKDIKYAQIGSQFVEPAFYLRQLLTGEQINGTIHVTH